MNKALLRQLSMECLGTFFFILTIALGLHPLAIASMLMAWVYIGGYISGGHYNPMVTLAIKLRERWSWEKWGLYAAAQTLGGIVAYAMANHVNGGFHVPTPGAHTTLAQAFVVEVLLAYVLAFIILVVATSSEFKNSSIFGFAIGFTIPALVAIGGPISGGLFNPAIALGSALCGLLIHGEPLMMPHLIMYIGGACLGGALAAYSFDYYFEKK